MDQEEDQFTFCINRPDWAGMEIGIDLADESSPDFSTYYFKRLNVEKEQL